MPCAALAHDIHRLSIHNSKKFHTITQPSCNKQGTQHTYPAVLLQLIFLFHQKQIQMTNIDQLEFQGKNFKRILDFIVLVHALYRVLGNCTSIQCFCYRRVSHTFRFFSECLPVSSQKHSVSLPSLPCADQLLLIRTPSYRSDAAWLRARLADNEASSYGSRLPCTGPECPSHSCIHWQDIMS